MRFLRPVPGGAACLGLLLAAGCGPPGPSFGEVEGVVTLNGKPLPDASVTFLPAFEKGTTGPASMGVTDGAGRYQLRYTIAENNPDHPTTGAGAVVGWHSVVVVDHKMLAEHLPPPGRVPAVYTEPATTPFHHEVRPGPQTFDFALGTPGR